MVEYSGYLLVVATKDTWTGKLFHLESGTCRGPQPDEASAGGCREPRRETAIPTMMAVTNRASMTSNTLCLCQFLNHGSQV